MPNTSSLNIPENKSEKITISESERGFSLIELMIGMVLFLIATGAIYGLMKISLGTRAEATGQVQLNRTTRIALNLIGRDTYNAGYVYPLKYSVKLPDNRIFALLGLPNDYDTVDDTVPPIIAGNGTILNAASNIKTDQVTFLFKDSTFNPIGVAGKEVSQPLNIPSATTTGSGIDEIVPLSGGNAACKVNDIYVITGTNRSTLGVVTALSGTDTVQFANGDLLGFNMTGTSGILRGITPPASMQRLIMVTYFVSADGVLTRREYANVLPAQKWIDQPLVYGVEDFQIKYLMDDGSQSDNPSAGADGIPGTADDLQGNLSAVRQLKFTVVARTSELNAAGQPYRITMSSTYSTRNLGYDAD